MKALVTTLGFLAAIGTTGAWLPQVIKTWKTKETGDFSWSYLVIFATGVSLWLVYGIFRKDAAVICANAVTLVLVLSIVAIKMKN